MPQTVRMTVGLTAVALVSAAVGFFVPAQAGTPVVCSVSSVADINTCFTNANAGANQDITMVLNNNITSDRNLTALVLPSTSTLTIDGNLKQLNLNGFTGFDLQANSSQFLTINSLTIYGGVTAGDGGAILLRDGRLSATGLKVRDSSATGYGGGVALMNGDYGSTITRSSFSGNTSGQFGGGVYSIGPLTLTNSTVYGNTAGGGGGVTASGSSISGISTVQFSTISGNSAAGSSSNISAFNATTQLRLIGTVVSNPLGSVARNCSAAVLSASYSVIGNSTGTDTSCGVAVANQIQLATTTALDLAAFNSSNGTLVPSATSVLVNLAPDALGTSITTDQNGVPRAGAFTVGSVQVDAADFSPSSSPVAFGSITVGMTSAASTLTVTNAGSAALTFGAGAVSIAGANASDFALGTDTCSSTTVAIGATCAVTVTFTPNAAGARSASLVFTDNAPDSPQSIALTGSGGESGGGGGGGSVTPSPTASDTSTPAPSTAPTPAPEAVPVEQTTSTVLTFQRGTTRLTALSRARLVRLIDAIPSGATQITVRITGVSSQREPTKAALSTTGKRAGFVADALTSAGLQGTYDVVSRLPRGIYRDMPGRVAVTVSYVS